MRGALKTAFGLRDVVRDLLYFRRTNLAVAAGCAVAAAVLGGALLVGDSVRASLRQITLERLGGVDHALAGQRFFDAGVPEAMEGLAGFRDGFDAAAPAILLRASAQHAESRARASDVGLQGVGEGFLELYGRDGGTTDDPLASAEGTIFPPVAINGALAESLGAEVGDALLISLQRWSEVPRGSLLSRDDTASVVETLRLEVVEILPDRELGTFGLRTNQSTRFNAFVRLADLQDALDQEGTINSVLVASKGPPRDVAAAREDASRLGGLLEEVLDLDDYGVIVRPLASPPSPDGGEPPLVAVESAEFVISPPLEEAVRTVAEEEGAVLRPILTYLANSIRLEEEASGRAVPYSTVTALDATPDPRFGELRLVDGSPAPDLVPGQALIDRWTAEELGLDPPKATGRRVVLDYFRVGPREELTETSHSFEIAGVLAMQGPAVDPELSQEYPGIAGSTNMADWDPPFPVDLGKIRTADEEYWDRHRGAPKVFVSLEEGQELWETRWGRLTAFRVALPEGRSADDFAAALLERLRPASFGLRFQPVKALGLDASAGATDFGGLFLGMSQFVIVSAALLVALLFGLGVEQRAAEVGLRLATGFRPKSVRRLLLSEGLAVAALGAAVGLVGAVGYAAVLMHGLRTWWRPAVGTSRLELFIEPASLAGGWVAALAVVALTIGLAVRRVGKVSTPRLLRGSTEPTRSGRAGRASKITAAVALAVGTGGLAFAFVTGRTTDPAIFYVVGPSFLVGLLALYAVLIDRPVTGGLRAGRGVIDRMALLNSRRHRRRSLLSATLIGCATFVVVTVAAFEEGFHGGELGMDSGAGGYELVAEADVPLQEDLADPDGRFELGLPQEAEALLGPTEVMPFRLLPGDDTSCLNLYQPGQPRVLGVPEAQIERGGFVFQGTWDGVENPAGEDASPWQLLGADLGENVIPAIGDANSTQWILKVPLGGDVLLENERGEEVRLRLVANLATSIFQSELLISEEKFLEHFPSRSGHPYFLFDLPEDLAADEVSTALEAGLERYGFDAVSTAEKLASFHAVQNTYLSTFRSLGGLGLLLGTLGLAVVLVRNVLERRGELAVLRAFGYRETTLRRLILVENVSLLVAGLVVGTVAALLTAGPKVLGPTAHPPWAPILLTLLVIFLVGLVACWAAARGALRSALLPALKSEA